MERIITAITPQKRNPNRVNIYLDGEYAFSLAKIVAAWLQTNQTLTEGKINDLLVQDSLEAAYQKGLRYLSLRAHSEKEMYIKLSRQGFSEDVINQTIERFKKQGYLGDAAFAQNWVENRSTFRPRSRRMVAMELRQKGVDQELIEESLSSAEPDEQLAYRLAEKYVGRLHCQSPEEFRRKLMGYLGRKGFSYDTIQDVARKILEMDERFNLKKEMRGNDYYGMD